VTTRTTDHAGEAAPTLDPVEQVAAAIRAHNIEVLIVETRDEARDAVLAMIPEGSEVHTGKSKTVEDLGLFAELMESGRYDAIRPRIFKMDRQTQGMEIRKLSTTPNVMVGSVAAVTPEGAMVAASGTGSQLAAYAAGAGRVILIIGSQKIVPDLDAALRRINDVVFPFEDAQVMARLGVHTILEKVLIIYGEWTAGRTTVVLVREPVGV
jgi:hypothetical protein